MNSRMILIISPPRSGSSMMGNILSDSGFYSGECKKGDEFNKNGYFENIAINKCLGQLLKGYDKEGKGRLFAPIDLEVSDLNLHPVMWSEFLHKSEFFIKNIKTAICWKIFRQYNPKIILLYRNREDIISSYKRTHFMDQFEDEAQMHEYIDAFYENMNSIRKHFSDTFEVFYDDLVKDSNSQRYYLNQFVGKDLNYDCITT